MPAIALLGLTLAALPAGYAATVAAVYLATRAAPRPAHRYRARHLLAALLSQAAR
ncbi:hypothetical protein ACFW1A_00935 [Kitasatospora sp. NPDC058965]|uniref:hypothetical protein n=1 Tax=Kitasatospora sp. NPDC058965 TaxID=3346682 RepID=UPI0036817925